MRINTQHSMELARRIKQRYGTWQNVRDASCMVDGVLVIRDAPSSRAIRG